MMDSLTSPTFDAGVRAALLNLFVWRRDVRRFKRDPLPAGTIERLVEIACLAPSVGLSEPWRFVIVDDDLRRAAIRENFESCNAEALLAQSPDRAQHYARLKLAGLDDAPCHVAVFADRLPAQGQGLGRRTMPETIDYSAVMAIHTLWLAARAEGIGLGWVSILEPVAVAAALEVPADWTFIGYLCLGYPEANDDTPALEREGWERRRPPASVILRR
jgi:5,6-dimethylbenzimidazole synthase